MLSATRLSSICRYNRTKLRARPSNRLIGCLFALATLAISHSLTILIANGVFLTSLAEVIHYRSEFTWVASSSFRYCVMCRQQSRSGASTVLKSRRAGRNDRSLANLSGEFHKAYAAMASGDDQQAVHHCAPQSAASSVIRRSSGVTFFSLSLSNVVTLT